MLDIISTTLQPAVAQRYRVSSWSTDRGLNPRRVATVGTALWKVPTVIAPDRGKVTRNVTSPVDVDPPDGISRSSETVEP